MRERNATAAPILWAQSLAAALATLWGAYGQPCLGQTARWVKLPEVRRQTESGLVVEMVARLPDTSIARGEDYVGYPHYLAHGIHSHVRNKQGRGTNTDNAAYLPGGWAFIAPEPTRFTFSEVMARTSTPFPSGSTAVRYWNRQPLYVFDELSAYTCGTIGGIEAGQAQSNRTRTSFRFMGACLDNARTVVALARERGYPHTAELAGYVQRVEYIHRQIASHIGGR